MVDRDFAVDLARVRLLALRALVAAGGRPRLGQWRRAVAPLVDAGLGLEALGPIEAGDLAHVGRSQPQGDGRRPGKHAWSCTPGRALRGETVEKRTDAPPWE